jgi:ribonuclease-3
MIFRPHPYRALEKRIGYRFWRRSRLNQALTHPSYRHEVGTLPEDNQRLEFLGDAALSLAAALVLFEARPDANEGEMTKMRSLLTSTKALAAVATRIELGAFLHLGKGEESSGGRNRTSVLADALEAVIGAAYVDGGARAVQAIFRTLFLPMLRELEATEEIENPKGVLQEWAQRTRNLNPRYKVVNEEGPAHQRAYTVSVWVGEQELGTGMGPNKREAETAAALSALRSNNAI